MTETSDGPRPGDSFGWFFNHLPAVFWQRRIYILATFAVALLAGLITAYALPTIYRSTATLLVQSQDLPTNLVEAPTTSAVEQRIARIRERVLSRGDLIALIEQNDLYPEERRSQPMSQVIENMRKSTAVGALTTDIGQPAAGQSNTIAINMSFEYPDPVKAQAVLQSFVTSFQRIDTENMEDRARLSVRFLEDQASKLQAAISQLEGQITSLKARNGAALVGGGGPQLIDTGSYSAQITGLEHQNRQLLAALERAPKQNPQVAAAEAALTAAMATFNDSHPDVITAKERLEYARRTAKSDDSSASAISAQIAANNATISSLTEARNGALARSQAAMAGQARGPAILEEAMQMESRVSALRNQYQDVSTNLLRARNSQRMASEQRAERLSLVEPPSLPDRPHWPNRNFVIGGSAAAGLLLGLFLALAIELFSRPLRSPVQVEAMGLPILGVVPVIANSEKKGSRFAFFSNRDRRAA